MNNEEVVGNTKKESAPPVQTFSPPIGPFQNREVRRRGLSKAGRKAFLNKDGTKIVSVKEQAKGAFGSPKGKSAFVTKISADLHKWVEPVQAKAKKSKKPLLE